MEMNWVSLRMACVGMKGLEARDLEKKDRLVRLPFRVRKETGLQAGFFMEWVWKRNS